MRRVKKSARLDFLNMPIGKFRGHPIRDLPGYASDYAGWILAQPWFRRRYPDEALALARATKLWSDPEHRQRVEDERHRAFDNRQAECQARQEREKREWLDRHVFKYNQRGIMPFGKYKGWPLADVARDGIYYGWFKSSVYARMNPELAADLKAMAQTITTGQTPMASVDFHDGGCVLYRPAMWCRGAQ
jgi:uncharacterized protein (DUF3820 family)